MPRIVPTKIQWSVILKYTKFSRYNFVTWEQQFVFINSDVLKNIIRGYGYQKGIKRKYAIFKYW